MADARPNIVVLVCHDLGRHVGCYGIDEVNTPRIDQFAQEGVRFSNAFCTAPQCSPSRASLFTGRYPHNNGVMGLTHGAFAFDLYHDERHMASLLREAGYRTAIAGVQHETHRLNDMGWEQIRRGGDCNGVADSAAAYFAERASESEPFFLQLGFFEPHRAFYDYGCAPDTSRGVHIPPYLENEPTAREDFAYFQGSINKLDGAFGRILDALDAHGMRDNTIVLFTTDHGIPFPRAKCSVYDPGLAIAQIMRWPSGGWRGGRTVDGLTNNVDILPTCLEAAHVSTPSNVQGRSLGALLRGESTDELHEAIFGEMTYHDYTDPRRCIRTRRYKLIANFTTAPFFMDPSQQWRPKTLTVQPTDPTRAYHPPIELYDLEADPLEMENLAQSDAHASVRRDLLQRLHNWLRQTHDPILQGIPTPPMHQWAMQALEDGELGESPPAWSQTKRD